MLREGQVRTLLGESPHVVFQETRQGVPPHLETRRRVRRERRQRRVNAHDVPTSGEMMKERYDGSAGESMKRRPSGLDGPVTDGQGETERFRAATISQDVDRPAVEKRLSSGIENGRPPLPIVGRERERTRLHERTPRVAPPPDRCVSITLSQKGDGIPKDPEDQVAARWPHVKSQDDGRAGHRGQVLRAFDGKVLTQLVRPSNSEESRSRDPAPPERAKLHGETPGTGRGQGSGPAQRRSAEGLRRDGQVGS